MLNRNLLIPWRIRKTLEFTYRNTSKIAVEINPDVLRKLENEEIKPQQHPGRLKTGHVSVPAYIIKGVTRAIGDYPVKTLLREAEAMNTYLQSRHPPAEDDEVRKKLSKIKKELSSNFEMPDLSKLSETEIAKVNNQQNLRVKRMLRERLFAWRPMSYGHFEALLYALSRGAMEFTILNKIFTEIMKRNPDFKARSYFDFGSGIGTGMWAASKFWKETIFEYFNVDSSRDMNELSDLILREGNENQAGNLKNVYYRQFLPASENKYDIVVSAFSLFELPNATARSETILNLWKKCDGYMIIVDQGTRVGFDLIDEARDLILNLDDPALEGHVFSPCPHDSPCPRQSNLTDRTPCNFEIAYDTLPIGATTTKRSGLYSYVVLKRGKRNATDEKDSWPRIVRPTLTRKKHSICRLCTSDGNLQEIIFTGSKHGKLAYKCARASNWGDRLPINVGEKYESVSRKDVKTD